MSFGRLWLGIGSSVIWMHPRLYRSIFPSTHTVPSVNETSDLVAQQTISSLPWLSNPWSPLGGKPSIPFYWILFSFSLPCYIYFFGNITEDQGQRYNLAAHFKDILGHFHKFINSHEKSHLLFAFFFVFSPCSPIQWTFQSLLLGSFF